MCVCLFKAVFAFQGCCCSVIKRRSTKGDEREKLLFSKDDHLLVRDTTLIRRTVAVDKQDHRGAECKLHFQLTDGEMKKKRNVKCCKTQRHKVLQEGGPRTAGFSAIFNLCVMITASLILTGVKHHNNTFLFVILHEQTKIRLHLCGCRKPHRNNRTATVTVSERQRQRKVTT